VVGTTGERAEPAAGGVLSATWVTWCWSPASAVVFASALAPAAVAWMTAMRAFFTASVTFTMAATTAPRKTVEMKPSKVKTSEGVHRFGQGWVVAWARNMLG
jgi:hypothetical protein